MIVIGLDVHKQSVTAVAVDEAGRPLDEKVIPVGSDELLGWACALDGERLWAVEDCRQLTRWLERQLLERGEELVRVPPKLTVPSGGRAGRAEVRPDRRARDRPGGAAGAGPEPAAARRAGLSGDQAAGRPSRRSGRSAPADAAAVALAPAPARPDLRRAAADARPSSHLERVGRWLARRAQELQVRSRASSSPAAARSTARSPGSTRSSNSESEVAPRLLELPGCAALTAAKLLAEIGPIGRFKTDAS